MVYDLSYQIRKLKREQYHGVDTTELMAETEKALIVAKEDYKSKKKNAKQHRTEDLNTLAKYNMEFNNNPDIAKEIKAIQHMESVRKSHARIGYVLKPRQVDANNGILIPSITAYSAAQSEDPNFDYTNVDVMWDRIEPTNGKDVGRWERITDKSKVHQLLIQWQCKHFTQSTLTPFVDDEWSALFMREDIQQQIIDGNYTPPEDLHPQAKDFLAFLKRDPKVKKEIQFGIDFDSFCKFVRKAKEKTSSSPSGRTYAHYKVLLRHRKKILEDIFAIMELAVANSIVLDRWKRTSTTLLLKDAGQPRIHRMRTIHIIEAELQFVSKYVYVIQMMGNAEKLGLISDEQYGGRNGRQAQSAVLNKICYGDISRQTRVNWACMDDDAKACYDRIIPCLSAVDGRKWGLSYEEAVFTTKILHSQIYQIRTATGFTKETYTYSSDNPIQGAGQGI